MSISFHAILVFLALRVQFSHQLCLLTLSHDASIFNLFLLWAQNQQGLFFWESYKFWHLTRRDFIFASAGTRGILVPFNQFFFFFFDHTSWHVGSWFPNWGSNLRPLQWKHGVLTTGPPGKSLQFYISFSPWELPPAQTLWLQGLGAPFLTGHRSFFPIQSPARLQGPQRLAEMCSSPL